MSDYESESEKSQNSDTDDDVPKKPVLKKPLGKSVAAPAGAPAGAATAAAAAASDSEMESDIETDDDEDEEANGVSAVESAAATAADEDEDAAAAAGDLDEDDEEFSSAVVEKKPLTARLDEIFHQDDGENSDEEYEDDGYLQKFDNQTKQNIIAEYYPELIQHNFDEVDTLCNVIRDEAGNICDPLHKTIPILSKYERTRIIGERARQLEGGAQSTIEVPEDMIDAYLISLRELEQKKIPFIIKRPLPNGVVEYWRLTDLEIL